MKLKFFLLVALAFLSCSLSALAQARIPINRLPFSITKPGNYYLSKDLALENTLTVPGGGAIFIGASNVDLDLNGRTMTASPFLGKNAAAIVSTLGTSVTVHNGAIRGFRLGVFMQGQESGEGGPSTLTSDLVCERLRISEFVGVDCQGITVVGNNIQIRDCSVIGVAKYGIEVKGYNMLVRDCVVSGAMTEAAVHVGGTGAVIEHCRLHQLDSATPQGTGVSVIGTNHLISACNLIGYENSILGAGSSVKYRDNTITNCTNTAGTDAGGNQ